jgi:hypothetical protein
VIFAVCVLVLTTLLLLIWTVLVDKK